MAKTTATAKTVSGAKTAPKKAVPAKVDEDLDELSNLVGEIAQLEAAHADIRGNQFSYLSIVGNSANDPTTRKGKPEYIEGADLGSWVIKNKKLHLGQAVTLTVLGMFKVYEDTVEGEKPDPKSKQDPMRKVIGYWMPQDAENIPVEGMFDRPYVDRDGDEHILRPVHWVRVFLHDHPEIEDALITFRSTGNSVYKQLQKLVSNNATSSTELRLVMTNQEIPAKGWDKEYLYPYFEIDGKNYNLEDGKVRLAKGGLDKETLATVLKTAHEDQKSYVGYKFVSKKANLASIVAGASNMIEDKTSNAAAYVEDDEEDEKPARF